MTETLWMDLNSGITTCTKHGGSYLRSAIDNRPRAHSHITPLGTWVRVTDADDAEFTAQIGHPMRCQTCGATRAA